MNELFPGWKEMENPPPLTTPVKSDTFMLLKETGSLEVPHKLMPKMKYDFLKVINRIQNELLDLEKNKNYINDQFVFDNISDGEMNHLFDGFLK
jgi:hypothetical protein